MSKQTNNHSAQLVAGLRQLADWLEAHPEVDGPLYPTILYGADRSDPELQDDVVGRIEVARLAYLLGSDAEHNDRQSVVERMFAGLTLRVYYNSRETMRRHEAASTYHGVVEPVGSPS